MVLVRYHTTPNVNILINQAKGDVKTPDINAEILRRVIDKSKGIQLFNTLVNPSEDLPEQMKPTLIILSPQYLANPTVVNGNTKPLIEKLSTKKGNTERIYRNTMLFLLCSEMGIGKLQDDIKNYLACNKINSEYSSQLSSEQKIDIRRKIDEEGKKADISLVSAYSIVAKYSVKNGIDTLIIKQFKDSFDSQINQNVIASLKEEEWLLESVGLSTLRNNNLLPTVDQIVKVKDVYEAFLRFDDKPMVTGPNAVATSLLKYCNNGEYSIATGDGTNFTRFYFKESIPFFDVNDTTYWMVDKSLIPSDTSPVSANKVDSSTPIPIEDKTTNTSNESTVEGSSRKLKSITISGNINDKLLYTQLMNYFIVPFKDNHIQIEVSFKISSTPSMQIDESKPQYKSAKEAAKQLGLNFEEES